MEVNIMINYVYDDGGREAAGFKGEAGDCVVRAISIGTNKPYKEVYDAMGEAFAAAGFARSGNIDVTRRRKDSTTRKDRQRDGRKGYRIQRQVMKDFGLELIRLKSRSRMTYTQAYAFAGDCVVTTTKHVCALKDGALHDTFDGRTYIANFDGGREHERKAMSIWRMTA